MTDDVSSTESALLREFLAVYPFQPATALWRAVEIGRVQQLDFPTGRGIDLGCGDGKLTAILARRFGGRSWFGIDSDSSEVEAARLCNLYDRLAVASASNLPEANESCDFAFSNSVLEHLDDLEGAVSEVARVLRLGGRFIFTVPSESFRACLRGPLLPFSHRGRYLDRLDKRLAHHRYLSPAQWSDLLATHRLEIRGQSRYLTRRQLRRWETISRFTAGVLYAIRRGKHHPIEIQRALGMRSASSRMPRLFARVVAALASAGGVLADQDERTGGLLIDAARFR